MKINNLSIRGSRFLAHVFRCFPVSCDPLFRGLRTLSIATAIVVAGAPLSANADPIAPERIEVIDGDTIRIDGRSPSHRLVDFNAPETFRAANPAEHELGLRAAQRLRALVRAGNLDYTEVPCSCRPGTEGTPA